MIQLFLNVAEQKTTLGIFLIGLLVTGIFILEYWSGAEIEFSVVYLIPVLLASIIDKNLGFIVSMACATLALLADFCLVRYSGFPIYHLWDFFW